MVRFSYLLQVGEISMENSENLELIKKIKREYITYERHYSDFLEEESQENKDLVKQSEKILKLLFKEKTGLDADEDLSHSIAFANFLSELNKWHQEEMKKFNHYFLLSNQVEIEIIELEQLMDDDNPAYLYWVFTNKINLELIKESFTDQAVIDLIVKTMEDLNKKNEMLEELKQSEIYQLLL